MTPPKIDRAIKGLRELLAREPTARSAILFGSCARGTARDDSDIDVLILVTGRRVGRLREAIHDLESAYDVNVSPVVLREEEIDRLDRQFLDSVLREGILLAGPPPTASPSPGTGSPRAAAARFLGRRWPPGPPAIHRPP